jgi:Protein of unknown function (DUF2975)
MNKINKLSCRFQLLFWMLFFIYPVLVVSTWLGGSALPSKYLSFARIPVDVELHSLRFMVRFLACLVEMLPTAIVMLGFYYLIQLFKLYAQNTIFGLQNVILIKKIGLTFIGQMIVSIVTQPLLSIILTMDAAPGGHLVAIGFGSDELSHLVIGGIVVLISWIMEEGRKLEEEKSLTI